MVGTRAKVQVCFLTVWPGVSPRAKYELGAMEYLRLI